MTLLGSGLLAIWHDLDISDSADLSDFQNWYRSEHFPERLGIPGFMRGRRYQSMDSDIRFSALYETKDIETLASEAYYDRLDNPTPWSRKNLARFRNTNRTAFNIEHSMGFGIGGALAVISVVPVDKTKNLLKDWYTKNKLPNMMRETDMVGAHLCIPNPKVTEVDSVESEIRDVPDQISDWVVLIESRNQETLATVLAKHFSAEECTNNGALSASITKHQLMHCANAGETSNFSLQLGDRAIAL